MHSKAQNVCAGQHTHYTTSSSSEDLRPPSRKVLFISGISLGYLVGVEAEEVEPEARLEQGREGSLCGRGPSAPLTVYGKQVVLLGHSTLVVGDHEIVVGHGDGQSVEDGWAKALFSQEGIVRR